MGQCGHPYLDLTGHSLIDVSGKKEFGFKDLFHQTHVNNVVHLNRSKSFFKKLLVE